MKLEIGYNTDIEIRREFYPHYTGLDLNIMYLSDLHLNKFSGKTVLHIIQVIKDINPTIILFGGDYIDTPGGLIHFENLLSYVSERENVFAIAGNHDRFYGLNGIKNRIERNNIQWIEKESVRICLNNHIIQIDGNNPKANQHNDCFKILCLHKPINIHPYKTNYHIAFAGHLHGCQAVFWQNKKGLFPGRFFYSWNMLKKEIGNCYYYIGKGLGDTLPIRFNCKREILIVETKKNKNFK